MKCSEREGAHRFGKGLAVYIVATKGFADCEHLKVELELPAKAWADLSRLSRKMDCNLSEVICALVLRNFINLRTITNARTHDRSKGTNAVAMEVKYSLPPERQIDFLLALSDFYRARSAKLKKQVSTIVLPDGLVDTIQLMAEFHLCIVNDMLSALVMRNFFSNEELEKIRVCISDGFAQREVYENGYAS